MLLLVACGALRAQSDAPDDTTGSVGRPPADSVAAGEASALEEQSTGADDDGELELLPEEESGGGKPGPWRVHWRARAAEKIQPGRGYTDGRYGGSRMKLYNRLTVAHGTWLSAGILMEKDPGEKRVTDHISGSLSLGGTGGYPVVVAGDFRIRAGQRLVFSGGRAFGKGSAVITPARSTAWGISSSPTADEFNYFRGVALGASFRPLEFCGFISRRTHAAVIAGDGTIRSLDKTGYHRTVTEIAHRDRVRQKSLGLLVRFRPGDALILGLNVLRSVFVQPGGSVANDPVMERGLSLDFFIRTPVVLYGEIASYSGIPSVLVGVLFDEDPRVRIILTGRSYPSVEGFTPSAGFGDRSGARNERGVYCGVEVRPEASTTWYAYLDVFSSPRPARGVFFPRRGVDRILGVKHLTGGGVQVGARLRNRLVEEKGPDVTEGGHATPANRTVSENSGRLEVRWRPGRSIGAGLRADFSLIRPGSSSQADRGTMLLADLAAEPVRGLEMKFRGILFSTDSYDARLYETEADLPGSLTSAVVYGRGMKWYVLLMWRPSGALNISTKFSRLNVPGRKYLGSGPEEIRGNVEERIGLQIDVRL